MKSVIAVIIVLTVIFVLPVACSGRGKIHATSLRSAYDSIRKVKNYIQDDSKKLEFQIAIGTLQQLKTEEGDTKLFLKTIDGKTADEIIALAKEEVNARILKGDPRYSKYQSWDQMVAELTKNTPRVIGRERPEHAFEE
ncbi:hypothetical protein MIN45_P1928 [Methylomarinovum tepidoasis]|uniref:Uncharacterized protein n=1 Tax=Methylomarinovum tepidoasis TaxID=2840183 RepID=A0AAU9C0F9_9GAMM|nr:hypothetical protein [Methylomarinovum sp. IN45]BCX89555.1 hypothetical protein MIN45_P1928 [Methylomarinovum sp. IN45]